jgi:hypothetical protein
MAAEIDWSTAEVEGGLLSVGLTEAVSKEWRERFAAVLARLGREGSGWGAVVARKQGIRVDGVQAGSEEELRHLLESAALQAGADERSGEDAEVTKESAGPDARMREAFRSFAPTER